MDVDRFPDTAAARANMVDSQVRPNKVTDPRVIDAMRALPRELFVPAALSTLAYVDRALPLGNGRVLMEPMVIARLVQLARARPGDRALVVGAGTGYGAALLAACGAAVTALEEDPALLAIATPVLQRFAPSVRVVSGLLSQGLPPGGPWSLIMIEGAVPEIPAEFAPHVADGGRLVGITVQRGAEGRYGLGQAVLAEPAGTGAGRRLRPRGVFDCSTPLLPGFERATAFTF